MFSWLTKRTRQQLEPAHTTSLDRLWPLVSLSRRQFDMTYGATLQRFAELHPDIEPIDVAEAAMRLRRGYLIPAAVAPEHASLTAEVHTYIVFIVSLASHLGYQDDTESARAWLDSLLPLEGKQWIQRPEGEMLMMFCTNRPSAGFATVTIVEDAHAAIIKRRRQNSDDPCLAEIGRSFFRWLNRDILAGKLTTNVKTAEVRKTAEGLLLNDSLIDKYPGKSQAELPRATVVQAIRNSTLFLRKSDYYLVGKDLDQRVGDYLVADTLPTDYALPIMSTKVEIRKTRDPLPIKF